MKKNLLAANWKMNPGSKSDAIKLAQGVKDGLQSVDFSSINVVLCVPSIYLALVGDILRSVPACEHIFLGAQNCYFEEKGAFTGELSAPMLVDAGVKYVILGHSERRSLFAETDALVSRKAQTCIAHGLIPIVCVGESDAQREANITDQVVTEQLAASLEGVALNGDNLIIAYEPIWAIGTGKTCSSDEAERVCALIRAKLAKLYNAKIAEATIIQYGGSVKSSTIAEQMKKANIDGALVGGASLIAEEFVTLVHNVQ